MNSLDGMRDKRPIWQCRTGVIPSRRVRFTRRLSLLLPTECSPPLAQSYQVIPFRGRLKKTTRNSDWSQAHEWKRRDASGGARQRGLRVSKSPYLFLESGPTRRTGRNSWQRARGTQGLLGLAASRLLGPFFGRTSWRWGMPPGLNVSTNLKFESPLA